MAPTSNDERGGATGRTTGPEPATTARRPQLRIPEHQEAARRKQQPQQQQPRARDFAPGEDGECH